MPYKSTIISTVEAAIAEARQGAADAANAPEYCRVISERLASIKEEMRLPQGPTHFIVPDQEATVSVSAASTPVIVASGDIPVTFNVPGWIVGMAIGCAEDEQFLDRLVLNVRSNRGNDALVVGSSSTAYMPCSVIRRAQSAGLPYFPLERRVARGEVWTVSFTSKDNRPFNQPVTGTATAMIYKPQLVFCFEQDRESRAGDAIRPANYLG